MGGDLQPFFAQRNIDPGASMKSNQFVTPVAPDSRADHELAIALARLEHQQRSGAPAVTISRAQATAAQPAGRPVALRVPGGNQPTAAPSSSSGSQYDGFPPAGGHGGLPQRPPAEAAPPLHYVGRASAAAPPMGYQNGQGYHNGHYQSGHRSAAPRGAPCAHSMQGEVHGNDAAAPPPAAISAAIENLTMAGGGTPVAFQNQQQSERWRFGSGDHYDAALGRQMSGIVAVPHTPRVNSVHTAPETSEMARTRLELRLKKYNLCERKIKGDGNCQFRAVADQLYRDSKYHEDVRRIAVHHLRSNAATYALFVPTDFWQYCWEMEQLGTWGDHVTLQAVADAFGLRICVLTSYPESAFIAITPASEKSHRCLYLSFWAEIHYQSLFPKSEPPKSTKLLGSKKLHRLFN